MLLRKSCLIHIPDFPESNNILFAIVFFNNKLSERDTDTAVSDSLFEFLSFITSLEEASMVEFLSSGGMFFVLKAKA